MSANSFPRTLFVLGTARDIGKTVTCIGIIAKLITDYGFSPEEIGYMKPVGQETVTVLNGAGVPIQADKDAVLVTALMGLPSRGYEEISPVVWQGGLSEKTIEAAARGEALAGQSAFMERIRAAYQEVAADKRIVVMEGTGQPGVGSVGGISNGDVVNMLRATGVPVFVILVTEGGIGSTIDEVMPYLMALEHLGTHVDGMIINGVLADKLDKIERYLSDYYTHAFGVLYGQRVAAGKAPPILGYVPTMPPLRWPTMRLISESFARASKGGIDVVAPGDFDRAAVRLVRGVKIVNLTYGYEPYIRPGDALIIGINANEIIMAMLLAHRRLATQYGEGLSGMILSCKNVGGLSPQVRSLIEAEGMPTIAVEQDSAAVIKRLDSMTVKIQPYDLDKRDQIVQTYRQYLDLRALRALL